MKDQLIATFNPQGELVLLPRDFVKKHVKDFAIETNNYVNTLGIDPVTVTGLISVLPGLFTNNFWKEAGPEVANLNEQSKQRLAVTGQLNELTSQILNQADIVNSNSGAALAQAQALAQEAKNDNSKQTTVILIIGGILLAGGVGFALWKNKTKRKKL